MMGSHAMNAVIISFSTSNPFIIFLLLFFIMVSKVTEKESFFEGKPLKIWDVIMLYIVANLGCKSAVHLPSVYN